MRFSPGNIVNARGREWIVLPDSTDEFVRLRPLGGADEESTGILTAIEPVVSAEFAAPDPDKPGDYRSSRLLRDAARLGVRTTAGPFRCFASIAVEPRPYQLVPLLMALRQDPVRLLIADDVGIGKTIEASLIARELRDRGEIQRIAVLCPPHLAEQWQSELRDKFHLDATLVLPGTAARLERALPPDCQSIFEHYPVVVVSLDYIKSERRRHEFLRTCPEFVIVDEAHTCSAVSDGRGSSRHQRFELISGLAAKPDQHLILVSATPHSGNEAAFRGLLGLLRPEFADLPTDLSGEQHRPLREKLAAHIVQRRRADIRAYLDQNTSFPDRLETEYTYELSPDYRVLFEKVLAYAREIVTDPAGSHRQRVQWWSVLALLRAMASSPAAASATLRARASVADTATPAEADDLGSRLVLDLEQTDLTSSDIDPGADTSAPNSDNGSPDDASLLSRSRLLALAKEADRLCHPRHDAKLARALDLVASLLKDGGSPIVFCRFIATADYVAWALREKLGSKYNVEAVTGALPSDERKLRVEELSDKPNRVLVCTDCLSEGINLQRGFDAVIHYDLSWNPTRHEQREGRVDRFGQLRPQVKVITYYGADNGIDGIVLDVLLRKHQAIRRSLGISVPIPVNTDQVINAVMEGLILRGHKPDATALLPGFEAVIAPERDQLAREWVNASEREKKSRSLFTQNTIKVEDVAREVEAMRATLGSRLDVQDFLEASLARYGAVRLGGIHGRTGRYDLAAVPVPVREAMSLSADTKLLTYSFDPAFSEGDGLCRFLTRTHPIPAGLAAYVVDTALDPLLDAIAARAGAMITRAVERRTTVLILRPRYLLLTRRGKDTTHETLAEDCFTAAFAGSPSAPEWLNAAALDGLLLAQPAGNILPELARERLRTVVDALPALVEQLEPLIAARAVGFAEANRRVRTAIKDKGWSFEVKPLPRPDILGLYVLLPAAPTA
jgi:superfamily II DNA or RNA helicase